MGTNIFFAARHSKREPENYDVKSHGHSKFDPTLCTHATPYSSKKYSASACAAIKSTVKKSGSPGTWTVRTEKSEFIPAPSLSCNR